MEWKIYKGTGEPHDGIDNLPSPPPWRSFGDDIPDDEILAIDANDDSQHSKRERERGQFYLPTDDAVALVNVALILRRPLLIEGKPGTGKSTLAYAVARELRLGPVLHWPITTSSTLQQGLYRYDALGRLQEAKLREQRREAVSAQPPDGKMQPGQYAEDIGPYVQLGPLGTALLPWRKPRVLLIDEIDKSDIDLPNDLLNIFEEGMFDIPELRRFPEKHVTVRTEDSSQATISEGRVRCMEFPLVILTNNGMREFPPAFRRRCLPLTLDMPTPDRLADIILAHFPGETIQGGQIDRLISAFVQEREAGDLATDQLMNAVYLARKGGLDLLEPTHQPILKSIMRNLSGRT